MGTEPLGVSHHCSEGVLAHLLLSEHFPNFGLQPRLEPRTLHFSVPHRLSDHGPHERMKLGQTQRFLYQNDSYYFFFYWHLQRRYLNHFCLSVVNAILKNLFQVKVKGQMQRGVNIQVSLVLLVVHCEGTIKSFYLLLNCNII